MDTGQKLPHQIFYILEMRWTRDSGQFIIFFNILLNLLLQ